MEAACDCRLRDIPLGRSKRSSCPESSSPQGRPSFRRGWGRGFRCQRSAPAFEGAGFQRHVMRLDLNEGGSPSQRSEALEPLSLGAQNLGAQKTPRAGRADAGQDQRARAGGQMKRAEQSKPAVAGHCSTLASFFLKFLARANLRHPSVRSSLPRWESLSILPGPFPL